MYDCLYSEASEWMRVKHNVLIYKLGQIKAQKWTVDWNQKTSIERGQK